MVEGHGELRFDIGVALEAQRGLRDLQQMLRILAGVDAMTVDAAYVCLAMCGALEIGMLPGVALEAIGAGLPGRGLGGIKDLGGVAAAIDMGLSRAMAVFTCDALAAVHLRHLCVRIGSKALGYIFVAAGAGI